MTLNNARSTLVVDDEERTLLDLIPAPRSEVAGRTPSADTTGSRAIAQPRTYDALGFDITAVTPRAAGELILQYAREGRSRQVHLCNAYTLTLARRDPELARALRSSDLNLPDGAPVAWLGRNAGTRGPVRGPGLTVDVLLAGVAPAGRSGIRHYLYGGAPGVAEAMAAQLHARDSRITIVGTECPPFQRPTAPELAEVAHRIRQSGADIVWIGLGTPRQDHVVAALAPLVSATLIPVGAAFDFIAGTVAEAPKYLHGSGFEWLYRLASEPRRLWRRYLLDGARFLYYVVARR